jgi:DNA topoisomerase II
VAPPRDEYERKTPVEHALLRPGMYIGSVEKQTCAVWEVKARAGKGERWEGSMQRKEQTVVPGMVKLFDEVLVNAIDNFQRDPRGMTRLDVVIDSKNARVVVTNNGRPVPVRRHSSEDIWIPELVFGHLLTGSNFGGIQGEGVVGVGGRHGYGAKLANIFSRRFQVEVGDAKSRLRYRQRWGSNMQEASAPQMCPFDGSRPEAEWPAEDGWLTEECGVSSPAFEKGGNYTRVAFEVDVGRFGRGSGLGRGTMGQMERRVWDAAGMLPASVQVTLNGRLVPVSGFQEYCALFPPSREATTVPLAFAKCGSHWEVGVALASEGAGRGGEHVSFVNGVSTPDGGSHVSVVMDEVARRVSEKLSPRLKVTAALVKQHLRVFVNCRVAHPEFDSQAKSRLTNAATEAGLGSLPVIPERLVRQLLGDVGLEDALMDAMESRYKAEVARAIRKTRSGSKTGGAAARLRNVVSVPKLEDAALAGTARGRECTLILTEGDSAKALAVAGLAVVGRDKYGVFPLRGKLLNVRDVPLKTVVENEEIKGIITALGIDPSRQYDALSRGDMRYGRVMIMADQDHDGSHIKGLVMNLFHSLWPDLVASATLSRVEAGEGFLETFVTPVIKARSRTETKEFFSIAAFDSWRRAQGSSAGQWSVKYYKGLGTSTAEEGREYFRQLSSHRVPVAWGGPMDGDKLDLAFNKSRSDDRKSWLLAQLRPRPAVVAHASTERAGPSVPAVATVGGFVDEELIEFSWADVHRSIPSVVDGLKPSQRKVLFASLERARGSATGAEIKVSQLAGAVAQATAYHHGEASLVATIVNMAQDYVGASNIHLLEPLGQFGTRLSGGKDAASARYIFTRLSPMTRLLFPRADDPLLPRCEDDGMVVEPASFVPIIPMALVNGGTGIGTGWSTSIPMHGPRDVLRAVRQGLAMAPPGLLERTCAVGDSLVWDSGLAEEWAALARAAVAEVARPLGIPACEQGHLLPWWRGFTGSVRLEDGIVHTDGAVELLEWKSYASKGRLGHANGLSLEAVDAALRRTDGKVALRVRELPVGRWTEVLKRTVSQLAEKGLVEDVLERSTDLEVDVTLALSEAGVREAARVGLSRLLRLTSTDNLNNMHMFDPAGSIRRYESAAHVMGDFLPVRLALYARRKRAQEAQLEQQRFVLEERARFIDHVVGGTLEVAGRPLDDVVQKMHRIGLPASGERFEALLRTPLRDFTAESVHKNHEQAKQAAADLVRLQGQSPMDLWEAELRALDQALPAVSGHLDRV